MICSFRKKAVNGYKNNSQETQFLPAFRAGSVLEQVAAGFSRMPLRKL